MVFADEEQIIETGQATRVERVERYEALHFGIAVRADVILGLPLAEGRTVRDQTVKYGASVID